jgi:uncharacterized protein with NRDE domain
MPKCAAIHTMCLMLIAYNYHPDYPLILASNRDEFYSRPTEPLAVRGAQQDMLCGLDLEGGGTWLGSSRSGRIAALTNVREPERHSGNAPSRGLLVKQCVLSEQPLSDCLNTIMQQADSYNGFNLITADSSGVYYCSNRTGAVQKLSAGLYGLSNHQLDTDWPKVSSAKTMFRNVLDSADKLDCEALFSILRTDECPPEHLRPDTGVGPNWERILAPIFIHSEIYGTRTSSLVLLARDGHLRFIERTHGSPGSSDIPDTREFAFDAQHT